MTESHQEVRVRPGKVEVVVIGEGLAALVATLALTEAGRRVVLLAEGPWAIPSGPAEWVAVPIPYGSGDTEVAPALLEYTLAGQQTAEELATRFPQAVTLTEAIWLGGVPPGAESLVTGTTTLPAAFDERGQRAVSVPAVRFNLRRLYESLADGIREAGAEIVHTRVRGVSVIEGQVLGAVTDAARWDARHDVFASEDPDRVQALSRMALEPITISTVSSPLRRLSLDFDTTIASVGGILWPADGIHWILGDLPFSAPESEYVADVALAHPAQPPLVGASQAISGAWHLLGTAGRPLAALGAAAALVDEFLS